MSNETRKICEKCDFNDPLGNYCFAPPHNCSLHKPDYSRFFALADKWRVVTENHLEFLDDKTLNHCAEELDALVMEMKNSK